MKSALFCILLIVYSSYTQAKLMVVNGLTHTFKSDAGAVLNGKIHIKNVGRIADRMVVYKNDLITDCANSSNFVEPNTHSRSLTNWLTTNVDERILQPNEEYELLYSIKIPNDSTLRGSYWGVFMIEGNSPLSEERKAGVMISSKARYAIQIITDIGQETPPSLTFDKVDFVSSSDSVKIVKVKLKNEGGVTTRTKMILDLINSNGEKVSTIESVFRRIYPNTCAEYELILKNVPKGRYEGLLMADYGQDLYATNIDIDIK